jgi:hypothetical protein
MTTMRSVSDAVSQLASDLEGLTISTATSNHTRDMAVLVPSLQQFYQTGLLLFQLGSSNSNNSNSNDDLSMAFRHLVDSIPDTLLQGTFYHLQEATRALIRTTTSNNNNNTSHADATKMIPTARSLAGLWTNSPRLCQVTYSNEWVSVLASLYDRMVLAKVSDQDRGSVLSCLSALFLDGLLLSSSKQGSAPSVEESLLEAIAAMEEESTDCLRDLQLWQSQCEPFRRTLESSLQERAEDGDNHDEERMQQREYILVMLESARQVAASSSMYTPTTGAKPSNKTNVKSKASSTDELDRRIKQVKQILPHLGEGFIEAALSLYQADVETTVATLLNDPSQYPSALRIMDPTLPRRKREHNLRDDVADAEQARQIVKERVALEEEREAQRYKALMYVTSQQKDPEQQERAAVHNTFKDEYNDDYDDQYDEVDIRLGGADDGFTMDMDFEQVKLYNQLVRDDEKEDSFWEETRNMNRNQHRSKSPKNNDDDDDDGGGKQYRGPDKIRGGRVIGPDGKIMKKPGGTRNRNNSKKAPVQPSQGVGGKSNNNNGAQPSNGTQTQQPGANNKKPKTKPKSDNRVNRRRDQKQRKQGNFGVQE